MHSHVYLVNRRFRGVFTAPLYKRFDYDGLKDQDKPLSAQIGKLLRTVISSPTLAEMVKNIQLRRLSVFQIRAALNYVVNISPVLQYPGISSLDDGVSNFISLCLYVFTNLREANFESTSTSDSIRNLPPSPNLQRISLAMLTGAARTRSSLVPVLRLPAFRHLAIGVGADVQLADRPEVPTGTVSLQSFDLRLENWMDQIPSAECLTTFLGKMKDFKRLSVKRTTRVVRQGNCSHVSYESAGRTPIHWNTYIKPWTHLSIA
jgi:hypothetical protein